MRNPLLVLGAIAVLALAACVAPPAQPVVEPPASTLPTPTQTTPTDLPSSEEEPPAAAPLDGIAAVAAKFLAETMNVELAAVQVTSVEPVEWRNSCLGVEKPGEMCLEVITPGYRIVLNVDGQEVAVHTNQDGSHMRLADPAQGVPSVKPVSIPWDPAATGQVARMELPH